MKIGVVSLGCPKNLVDSETMLGLIHEDNFEITNDPAEAEIIIVNTCGFIESAKEESINTILQMAEYKKSGSCRHIIVTGCLGQRYAEDLFNELPEVDAIAGVEVYDAGTQQAGCNLHQQRYLFAAYFNNAALYSVFKNCRRLRQLLLLLRYSVYSRALPQQTDGAGAEGSTRTG